MINRDMRSVICDKALIGVHHLNRYSLKPHPTPWNQMIRDIDTRLHWLRHNTKGD